MLGQRISPSRGGKGNGFRENMYLCRFNYRICLEQDTVNSEDQQQLPPLMLAYNAESPLDFMCGTVCR